MAYADSLQCNIVSVIEVLLLFTANRKEIIVLVTLTGIPTKLCGRQKVVVTRKESISGLLFSILSSINDFVRLLFKTRA